jgi:ankyrin repeat protein
MSQDEIEALLDARLLESRAVFDSILEEVTRRLDAVRHVLVKNWQHNPMALVAAAQEGHVGAVRLLLERGVEVDTIDPREGTALHAAARECHEEVVSILLSSGADVYRRTDEKETPLILASSYGHLGVVRQLLKHMRGRGLNLRDSNGSTALHHACEGGYVNILRAVLLAGADHTLRNREKKTPRQQAEVYAQFDCVALIRVSGTRVSLSFSHHCLEMKVSSFQSSIGTENIPIEGLNEPLYNVYLCYNHIHMNIWID